MKIAIRSARASFMHNINANDTEGREWRLRKEWSVGNCEERSRTLVRIRESMIIDLRYWKPVSGSAKSFIDRLGV